MSMARLAWAACMLAACGACAQGRDAIAPFSRASAGDALPGAWKARTVGRVPAARIALVDDGGTTVLQVTSSAAAGAAAHILHAQAAPGTTLAWRWKVDRVVEGANLERRAGDDFAARLYVFFDVPEEAMPLLARIRMRLARLLHGEDLPSAGICYVWDNRHPVGLSRWSAYTDRIRIVVQESGPARAGQWVEAQRDIEADFRAAFGAQWKGAMPAISGVAVGNDTDQTREAASASFGDIRLEARR